jgi:hypothetical protein
MKHHLQLNAFHWDLILAIPMDVVKIPGAFLVMMMCKLMTLSSLYLQPRSLSLVPPQQNLPRKPRAQKGFNQGRLLLKMLYCPCLRESGY